MRFLRYIFQIILIISATELTSAAIPQMMNYQARLLDEVGYPINGNYAIQFAIYSTETGGSFFWYEIQNVTAENGYINVKLGSENPINLDFDKEYWLEIKLEDSEPFPRVQLTSVPYTFQSQKSATADLAFSVEDGSITYNKIGSGAVGTIHIADGSISTEKIKDGSIKPNKIGSGAVGTIHIADGAISTDKIQDGSIKPNKIGSGAVGTIHIADGAVSGNKIQNGSITGTKIAENSIGSSNLKTDETYNWTGGHKFKSSQGSQYQFESNVQSGSGNAVVSINNTGQGPSLFINSGSEGTALTSNGDIELHSQIKCSFNGITNSYRIKIGDDVSTYGINIHDGALFGTIFADAENNTITGISAITANDGAFYNSLYSAKGLRIGNTISEVAGTIRWNTNTSDFEGYTGLTWKSLTSTVSSLEAWGLLGNAGTEPGTNFIGTTDNTSLVFKVNDSRVIEIIPTASTPNIVAGCSSNSVGSSTVGATISGGGCDIDGAVNTANGDFSTISGGEDNNTTGQYSSIAGGKSNSIVCSYSSIGGGLENIISGSYSVIPGGQKLKLSDGSFGFRGGLPGSPIGITDLSGVVNSFHVVDANFFFNSNNIDADFRVDGNGASGTFTMFVDASENRIGIGTSTPTTKLDVEGGIRLDNATEELAGVMRWNGTMFQGYNGIKWLNMGDYWLDITGDVIYLTNLFGLGRAGCTVNPGSGAAAKTHINLSNNSITGEGGFDYFYCTVSGGSTNQAGGEFSTVSGGLSNYAAGTNSVIPGGSMLKVGTRSFGFRGGIGSSPVAVTDVSGTPETFHIVDANFYFNYNKANADFRVNGEGVAGDYALFVDASTARVGLGVSNPTSRLELPNTVGPDGEGKANSWNSLSDGRIKYNQRNLEYGLNELMLLTPKRYEHHNSSFSNGKLVIGEENKSAIGLIAQEVFNIIPEVVSKPADEQSSLWSLDYSKLVPVLINAIKQQQAEIEELQKKLNDLNELVAEEYEEESENSDIEFLKLKNEVKQLRELLQVLINEKQDNFSIKNVKK